MNFITGEELLLLAAPQKPRHQLGDVMAYLHGNTPATQKVCALYGLRRTGKTTIMLQAIKELLREGADPTVIGYYTGKRGDSFDDLAIELDGNKELEYLFIDEVGFFTDFVKHGNVLYDMHVRLLNRKVVIAGTNLLSMYVAEKNTLFDRTHRIQMPFLSFYEHCSFVLHTTKPTRDEFLEYMRTGGLFERPTDIPAYVQSAITGSINELFHLQPESETFTWLKPGDEPDQIDWKAYINTILLLSSNYIASKHLERNPSILDDIQALDNVPVTRAIRQEFNRYFSLNKRDRDIQMPRSETVALLDFLVDCGVINVLPNLYRDAEPYKCYVSAPFLRYHFTSKLGEIAQATSVNESTPLYGDLLEACIVNEYKESNPAAQICFARTHFPTGADRVAEIDLVDLTSKEAYEVKLSSAKGYLGFEQLGSLSELQGFSFTLLDASNYTDTIYGWGERSYREETTQEFHPTIGL